MRVVLFDMNSIRSTALYSSERPPALFVMNLNITKKRKTLKLSSPEMDESYQEYWMSSCDAHLGPSMGQDLNSNTGHDVCCNTPRAGAACHGDVWPHSQPDQPAKLWGGPAAWPATVSCPSLSAWHSDTCEGWSVRSGVCPRHGDQTHYSRKDYFQSCSLVCVWTCPSHVPVPRYWRSSESDWPCWRSLNKCLVDHN